LGKSAPPDLARRPRESRQPDDQSRRLGCDFEVIAPATRKSSETIGTIWSIGLDGTGIKQLTRGADDRSPTWSDDGARIYFQRHFARRQLGHLFDGADGTNPTPVLQTYAQDERGPVVVPQTSQIAFVESSSDTPARVRLLNVLTKAGSG